MKVRDVIAALEPLADVDVEVHVHSLLPIFLLGYQVSLIFAGYNLPDDVKAALASEFVLRPLDASDP